MLLTIRIMNFCMEEQHVSPFFTEHLVHKVYCMAISGNGEREFDPLPDLFYSIFWWWRRSHTFGALARIMLLWYNDGCLNPTTSKWYGIDQVNKAAAFGSQWHSGILTNLSTYKDIYNVFIWHLDWSLLHLLPSRSHRHAYLLYFACGCILCSCLISSFDLQSLLYSSSRAYSSTHVLDDKLRRLQICSEFFAYMALGSFDEVLAIFCVWQLTFNPFSFFWWLVQPF